MPRQSDDGEEEEDAEEEVLVLETSYHKEQWEREGVKATTMTMMTTMAAKSGVWKEVGGGAGASYGDNEGDDNNDEDMPPDVTGRSALPLPPPPPCAVSFRKTRSDRTTPNPKWAPRTRSTTTMA